MKLERPLVVLDLETTGTWIEKDRIVEIGMMRKSPDGEVRTYVRRVNPGVSIPPAVSRLIGITDQDVKNEPPFKAVAQEALAFIGDADLGGFNIERFDLPLLERELFEAGFKFEWRGRALYDAQKIYHVHEKRDLSAAYKFYCQKELLNAHTALGDSEAALAILAAQIERYGKGSAELSSLKDIDYAPNADFFDEERRFRWWNGELYPVFGKYARKYCLKEIARKDRAYLEWICAGDFNPKVKELIRALLAEAPSPAKAPFNGLDFGALKETA